MSYSLQLSWVPTHVFVFIFPPVQLSPSIKVKSTRSHLGQKRLCKANKDTSPWEINSYGPLLCNLFLSPRRMNPFPDHPLYPSRKLECSQLLKEMCYFNQQRKNLIYLNLQPLKWLIFWKKKQTLHKYDSSLVNYAAILMYNYQLVLHCKLLSLFAIMSIKQLLEKL